MQTPLCTVPVLTCHMNLFFIIIIWGRRSRWSAGSSGCWSGWAAIVLVIFLPLYNKRAQTFQNNNWIRAVISGLGSFLDFSVSAQVRESESPGQFHLGDTHLVWWSSWGHRAAEGVGVGEEGTSLGHVRVSAPLSHIWLQSDWCTSHAAPSHLCSPASNKCTII